MAQLRSLSQGKLEAYKIDPRELVIREGFNYRDTSSPQAKAHIAWLIESIRERGVDEPIWVENTGDELYVIDGECRVLALRALWDEGLEVIVPTFSYKGDEAAVLAKSLIANGGLPPSQLEFGKAVERLLAYGWTRERIAQHIPPHLGLSGAGATRYVDDALELQQAPLEVKKALKEGVDGVEISPALAVAATKKNRIMATEIIREEAAKAKAAGKKVATRPKGAGKATKAKAAKEATAGETFALGDKMADVMLSESPNWTRGEKLAQQWNKARGR